MRICQEAFEPHARSQSQIEPAWVMTESQQELYERFHLYNALYFEGRLEGVEVKWSDKMTLCAGLCSFNKREGFCSIRLSRPLLKLRPKTDYIDTLLHEMIHAFLFIVTRSIDRDGHGPDFQSHMNRINKAAGTTISIYHNFNSEVDHYRKHVWKCNGKCQLWPPFFGVCKRAMNRPPQKADWWWKRHQATCGGTFIKINEPEKKQKPKKENLKEKTRKESLGQSTLDDFKNIIEISSDSDDEKVECPDRKSVV